MLAQHINRTTVIQYQRYAADTLYASGSLDARTAENRSGSIAIRRLAKGPHR